MLGATARQQWEFDFKSYWKARLKESRSKFGVVRAAVGKATATEKHKRKRDREKRPRVIDRKLQNAADDVERLYRLWKAAYGEQYRRRKDADPVSAKNIAAKICGVTVSEISFYMRHHKRPEIIEPKPTPTRA